MTNMNTVPKQPLRCLGYARVSTGKQAGEVDVRRDYRRRA